MKPIKESARVNYLHEEIEEIIISLIHYKSGNIELNDAWHKLLVLKEKTENDKTYI